MAEINFNTMFDQLTDLEKQQYEGVMGMGGFQSQYEKNPNSPLVTQNPNYEKFKSIADTQAQIPETSMLGKIGGMLNPFSSASASEVTPGMYGLQNMKEGDISIEDLTNNTDAGNFLISAANALPNQSGIINALPNIMSPGVTTIENQAMRNFDQPYNMRDVAGESLPFNIDNLGNPNNDPRVVSEELGMTGYGRPSMMDIAGTSMIDRFSNSIAPVAPTETMYEDLIMNPENNPNRLQNLERNIDIDNEEFEEIPGFNFIDAPTSLGSRLQNLEYFNNPRTGFIDNNILARGNPNKGLNMRGIAGPLLSAYGALAPSNIARLGGLFLNRDKISKGLGSIATKLRGGGSQADYDRSRSVRQSANRLKTLDKTLAKQAKKGNVSQVLKDRRDRIANEIAASRDPRTGNTVTGFGKSGMGRDTSQGGGDTGASSGKIVCTMMNNSYGFGSFRNKIWLKHSRDLPKEYEVGYHTIFLPLVKFAKGEGKLNKVAKKILEHIARHRTYDLKQEMKGKTHLLGRAYRKVLEPICYIVGKASMFTRRG